MIVCLAFAYSGGWGGGVEGVRGGGEKGSVYNLHRKTGWSMDKKISSEWSIPF